MRRWWAEKKPLLQAQLRAGTYRFREQQLIRGAERTVELWSAMDTLVLNAMAIALAGDNLKSIFIVHAIEIEVTIQSKNLLEIKRFSHRHEGCIG